jgi:hypothetical protein
MTYDVDYFIAKFSAIPDAAWLTGEYEYKGKCCALGHCGISYKPGATQSEEADALIDLFTLIGQDPTQVNDGEASEYPQLTPKERILAALRDIKAREAQCSH